jgi:putative lipase involved disintegration of autophagic bodies
MRLILVLELLLLTFSSVYTQYSLFSIINIDSVENNVINKLKHKNNKQTNKFEFKNKYIDPTDKDDILTLAKLSESVYYDDQTEPIGDWYPNQTIGYNYSYLQLYIYSNYNNSFIVAFKGTSLTGETSENDKFQLALLYSCCCSYVNENWENDIICNCHTDNYKCDTKCLNEFYETTPSYYTMALKIFNYFYSIYPNADYLFTGHSLGGIGSLLSLSYNYNSVTFGVPPLLLYTQRLNLELKNQHLIYNYGNNLDVIFQGTCNGFSFCSALGYALETFNHIGLVCEYKKSGISNLRHHRISNILYDIENWNNTPKCEFKPINTDECNKWKT